MSASRFFLAGLFCLCASVGCSAASAGDGADRRLAELEPLGLLAVDLTSPTTTIVSPALPAYEPIARELADALEKSTGRRPALRPDTTPAKDLGPGPVISLGGLTDSQLGRRLYLDAYDFTDYAWPSAGGHVVRTVRDPLGTGAHVLVVGGSDVAGVADAAAELAELVQCRGGRLGYVNRVKLGKLAAEIKRYTEGLLGDDVKKWKRVGGSGSWDHQIAIAKAAIGYLRTADERYLAGFRSELRYWLDHDVFHPGSEAPPMLHGFLHTILIPWDLVADHPSFSPEERRRIDADFLAAFRVTGRPVVPRQDLLGVAVAPLAPLWYETYEGGPKGDGFFVVNQPLDACFDKISIREGWKPDDFYLRLDGVSGGVHAYQDANCIVRLSDQGVHWLASTYRETSSATVRSENGVLVALDAAGPGRVQRYARRLYAGEGGKSATAGAMSPWLAVGAALEGLGDIDWQRHILRRRGRWTLVIDVALPMRAGEALIERHWHFAGSVQSEPDGMTCTASQRALHLQTVGVVSDGARGGNDRAEIVRRAVTAGQPVSIATLLHANRSPQQRDVTLRQTGRAWRVDDADGTFFILPETRRPEGIAIISRKSTKVIGAIAHGLPSHDELMADKEIPSPVPLLPTADGRILWDADVAGAAEAVAVQEAGRDSQVYCASNSGYVCGIDGPTGKRRVAAFVGRPTNFVATLPNGRVLAVALTGEIFVLASDGKLAGRISLGSEITALLRPGDHRAANRVILGTKDGRMIVLSQ